MLPRASAGLPPDRRSSDYVPRAMPLRFLLAVALVFALHVYLGVRLIEPAELPGAVRGALWAALIGSVFLHPLNLIGRRERFGERARQGVAWASYAAMAAFALLLSLVALRDVLWLLALVVDAALVSFGIPPLLPEGEAQRRALLVDTNLVVVGTAAVLYGVGFLEARRRPRVRRVRVPIEGLPAALEGFRVVQLSDVHIGPTIRRAFLEAVVDEVNAQEPHVVAITGDLVDGTVDDLGAHTAPLGRLRAAYGAYFVTGNHEYYSGALPWVSFLSGLGLEVLLNEHRVVEHGGHEVVVAGVCDYSAGHFVPDHAHDPGRAIEGAPDGAIKLLLAHQPRSAFAAKDHGFHLQLSGHTHGGQFIPWNFFVPLQQPFVAGLHKVGDMWVYTSSGTGYWGPPLRLGAPSEITLVELARA